MAGSHFTVRCALCGRKRDSASVILFALLAAGCARAGIKLKARSIAFDPACARRAFKAIQRSDWEVS